MSRSEFRLGCEMLLDHPPRWMRSARLGILSNQASVNQRFEHVVSLVKKSGGHLTCLFTPQHGFFAEKQANMIESDDGWDSASRIPVFSLYGRVRQPTAEMLSHIDVLIIDLQDVGTRVYTYSTTMGLCMEAAAAAGVKIVVLDRPNPIGGEAVEGNILQEDHRSFVGRYAIPMRHGLTMGEFARFIVMRHEVPCDLEVIEMKGWKRGDYFPDTGLPWVFPSPNMPSWETTLLYPGMVLFEGTNISEGRGTTLPFQLFGAPFLDHEKFSAFLEKSALDGFVFRPVCFEPVFDKWKGELCHGFQIHIVDHKKAMPYRMALTLLQGFCLLHGDRFEWLPPPYEYETEKKPIDILMGNRLLRERLEAGDNVLGLESRWAEALAQYRAYCGRCGLYT